MKRSVWLLLLSAAFLFGQSDRGTITGSVTDPSGASIPDAQITITNTETDLRYQSVTTGTGNYTVPSLPSGVYKLTVEAKGFNKFEQTNLRVQVAVTTRIDVAMQVGPSATSVLVTGEASLLKTESAEQSTTISGEKINSLPINFGIGAGAIRNPLSFVQLTPGANISGWNTVTVNGMPSYSFKIVFEGQESSSGLDSRVSDESQPSVEAIQEFTLQTSNFAAEFGQVAGGLFNFTSRIGANQFHGSAYSYVANEALNAGVPFTNSTTTASPWAGRSGCPKSIKARTARFSSSTWNAIVTGKASTTASTPCPPTRCAAAISAPC
ncbi:MAG: carboxypeptidase-like regulatory domain-containing protein [Candidatus Solibacter sp.]|nr:carboxypeptidase-like regulatory domain-containing protein [Candidatus Solibacter sp.]